MKSFIKKSAIASFTLALALQAFGEQTWTVNFKDSDIQEVVKFVADVTGRTMVVDQRVRGRVKVISAKPLTQSELMALFRVVLEMNDFTLIEVAGIQRIIPLKDARGSPVPIVDKGSKDRGYITKLIQLKNIAAAKVLPVIRPLLPQNAHLAAYDPSNAIVIADDAENIDRIIDLIERIDKSATPTTEIVELKYASAGDLVTTLTNLDKADAQNMPQNALRLIADKRNNAILVTGEDIQRQRIKLLISRLDKPKAQNGNVRVIYLDYAKAKTVAETLTKIVQNISKLTPAGGEGAPAPAGGAVSATVEADEETNSLLITASGDTLTTLLSVVERLDIRRAQVMVEAIIVEMSDATARELGIQWMFRDKSGGTFGGSGGTNDASGNSNSALIAGSKALEAGATSDGNQSIKSLGELAAATMGAPGQIIGVLGTDKKTDFAGLLSALETDGKTNILSTPTILTMDNKEATFQSGQQVPFVTGSFTGTGGGNSGGGVSGISNPFQTIQRQDVGIKLKVKPHVNEGNKVVMDITQEVSGISKSAKGAADIITDKSSLETQVMANDGEIIVMGGLTKDESLNGEKRVPVLGSIPVVGRLFRSNNNSLNKKNIMVFLRTTVIRDDEALTGATAEKYNYIRQRQLEQRKQGFMRDENKTLPVIPELIPKEAGGAKHPDLTPVVTEMN